jgi:dihydropteroate synthase
MVQPRADALPVAEPADPLARLLAAGRTLVMGILNVTPDSFSDGGRFIEPKLAIDHAARMAAEGADILDIGAESSRPYGGNKPVDADEEIARLTPVLRDVVALGLPVSIDTMKAAVGQGAVIANDVWGLQRDPDMAGVVARHGVPVIVMHNRASVDPALDILADMMAFFERTLAIADGVGIARDKLVLDPGIGFGKSTPDQSLEALAHVDRLKKFGLPVLVGASRKRFIDAIRPAPPDRRIGGSIAAHLVAVQKGAAIIRSHDVAETVQALAVMAAIGAK